MKILFYGFRHSHIDGLFESAKNNSRIEISACIEEDETARKAAEEKLGIQFDNGSYDEWLKTDIDIVAIGGRYGDRGKAIIKALQAGKHIIADKPICTKMEEYEEIARLAKEENLKISCMFVICLRLVRQKCFLKAVKWAKCITYPSQGNII